MYSVDPKVYETYKKSDKKPAGDSKKLKPVSGLNEIWWANRLLIFRWVKSFLEFVPTFVFDMFYLSYNVK